MEKELIDQFIRRVSYGKSIQKIDSFGAHSGFPSYFYCEHCGIPTEAFPEFPLKSANTGCSQCSYLKENQYLEKIKEISRKFFHS